jgi:SAM-dependent methyltransferase
MSEVRAAAERAGMHDELERVACPLCGQDDADALWSRGDAHYVRCRACSLVYENPRLTERGLVRFYSAKSYFVAEEGSPPTSGYQDYESQVTRDLLEEYFDIVQSHAPGPGALCDVGCGPGGLLRIARDRGWQACGVEISSWAARRARDEGLDVHEGSLSHARFPDDAFDAVTMFDVLEHLAQPGEVLHEVFRILKPGGVFVAETPNVDGFFARHVYRERAHLVKPRAHICLYGPRSARRLVSGERFSSAVVSTFPYCRRITPGYLKSLVTSRLVPGRAPVQLTLDDSLRLVCRK